MKLLYIVNRIDGPGGLERVLSIKASLLAEKYGYDVTILTLNQENNVLFYNFSPKIKYYNLEVTGNPINYIVKYALNFRKAIKIIKPDIISVCDDGLKGFFLPLVLGRPCPMIYERHVSRNIEIKKDNESFLGNLPTKIKFSLMNLAGKYYNRFIVLTQGNLNEWNFKNLMVIPNPLSFYPLDNKISTLQNKKVLAVGKQSYQKGYDRLLKSWKAVNDKYPDWELNIYGTINESEGLQDLAKDLEINNSVNFYKPVKNIEDKYQESSIYVMSSRYEGFGMVLIEAMAYGVPCISFDCPYGPSDIISDNIDGYLVPNGDIETLSNRINILIENTDKRLEMGKNARENAKQYLPEKVVEKWHNLFVKLTTDNM